MNDAVTTEKFRDAMLARARDVRDRIAMAAAVHRGAMLDAGALKRAVLDAKARHGRGSVLVEDIEDATGLTRPTLNAWAAVNDVRDVTKMPSSALAQEHLGYGPGQHEEIDGEFWTRFPWLRGWWDAMSHLQEQAYEVYYAKGEDPPDDLPRPPGYGVLATKYYAMVRVIAEEGDQG